MVVVDFKSKNCVIGIVVCRTGNSDVNDILKFGRYMLERKRGCSVCKYFQRSNEID